MTQDPNLPKIKIGDECKRQVEPLVLAFEQLIKAVNPPRGLIGLGQTYTCMKSAKQQLSTAESNGVISQAEADKISDLIGQVLEFPTNVEEAKKLFNNLGQSATLVLDALLDAAVDCECREAKAIETKLGSEDVQRILETEEKLVGKQRPRSLTEMTGEE